jgi:hypothetical protein
VVQRTARIPNATRRRKTEGVEAEPAGKRRGTGRTARGRQTRQDLIDAAQQVFERVGFLHARVADICAEAGISHGSFYTYFVSKEEVFNEIVDSVEFDLLTVEGPPEGADPVERIRAANRHYLEAYREHAGILRVIQQVSRTRSSAAPGTTRSAGSSTPTSTPGSPRMRSGAWCRSSPTRCSSRDSSSTSTRPSSSSRCCG